MPLEIAIVGSGPSGFYAAEGLLEARPDAQVTLYEKLPVPFGLVRYGVAPDHPRLKATTAVFDRIAQHPNFRFVGNTTVGRDVTVEELQQHHHAVIFAYGAGGDRRLDIPGEALPGSHAATEFVGWYNGHPDYRDQQFDLSQDSVAIIGQGNVAADLARMLLLPADVLDKTDIAAHAVKALRLSRVRDVHIIGRRGPAQAKFTVQELRELGELPDVEVCVRNTDLDLNETSVVELQDRKNFQAAKNVELFRKWTTVANKGTKRLTFHFLESPVALLGDDRVEGLALDGNRLVGPAFAQRAERNGKTHTLKCGLVIRSVGYHGFDIDGLPFDARRGVIPNTAGRVQGRPGLYATGWIKRGPSGIIGTNRACAMETVSCLLDDQGDAAPTGKHGAAATLKLLAERGIKTIDYPAWRHIDAAEITAGQKIGKPREKLANITEMLAAANV